MNDEDSERRLIQGLQADDRDCLAALYDAYGKVVGAVGVSGDTSCADHMIGWRVRTALGLDFLAGKGVSGDAARPDNIIYDIAGGVSASGFGHPTCINTGDQTLLPAVQ